MWNCMVCKEDNEDSSLICKNCGFDQSRNWLQYPTISKLTPAETASWEKQRNSSAHYSDLAETHLKKAVELYKKSGNLSANEQDILNVLKKTITNPETPEDKTKQTVNPTITNPSQNAEPTPKDSRKDSNPAADHSRQDSIPAGLLMGKTVIFSVLSGILIYMISLFFFCMIWGYDIAKIFSSNSRAAVRVSDISEAIRGYFLFPFSGLSIAFYILCPFLIIGIAGKRISFYDSAHPDGRNANGTLFKLLYGVIIIVSVCIDVSQYISFDFYLFWKGGFNRALVLYLIRAANIAGGYCLYDLVSLWARKKDPKKYASVQLVLSGLFLMIPLLRLEILQASYSGFDSIKFLYTLVLCFAYSYFISAWYGWFLTRKLTEITRQKN